MQNHPAIILVSPQMGENIGAAARVMANFGFKDLRIVSPRDGWPNPAAETMSAGAFEWGVEARVFASLADALSDVKYVLATTARPRGMVKPVFDALTGCSALRSMGEAHTAVMFGAEKTGLLNDEVTLADAILTYPVDKTFSSLNLAQAVGVFVSTWQQQVSQGADDDFKGAAQPAERAELIRMCEHFENELEEAGFFFPPEKKPVMTQNLRNAFSRAGWTQQEVQTFRGAIKALAKGRQRGRGPAK